MKRTLSLLLSATVAIAALPAVASAQQGWQNINQRQAQLDQRIDVGVRSGQLNAAEAARLRAEFADISRLEARYRTNGLSPTERADLDRRFDALSARVRFERNDRDGGGRGWQSINQRQAQLDQRIDVGVRNGQITATEAARLRAEFGQIVRLEANYRMDGISPREQMDLDGRFDRLSAQIRDERRDNQRAGRGGRWDNVNLNERQAQFQQRLDRATRERRITPAQAANLRAEFRTIAGLEMQYRRGGLNPTERAELDRRLDRLQANFRASVQSSQYAYGYGQAPNLFDWLFGL